MFNREKFFAFILDLFLKQGGKFTQGQVYRILWEMNQHDMLFHLDDDPWTIIGRTGFQLFNTYEATILRTVVPAFFGVEVLPDFSGDPHEICCQLTLTDEAYGRYRTLPRWAFSFDDETTVYVGYTEPRRWNGWGCPLLSKEQVERLLSGMETGYIWAYRDRGYDVINLSYPDEVCRLEGELVRDLDGMLYLVYDMREMGLCFNVGDCREINAGDWEGYL